MTTSKISAANYQQNERQNNEQVHYRACHLCEAICGLEIKTRGEDIISIKGDKNDPLSRCHICPKATALADLHTDPDRLRKPVRREGDQWVELTWQEAFDLVGEKLSAIQQHHGDDAVATYSGNPGTHNYGCMTHGGALRKTLNTKSVYTAASMDQLPLHLTAYAMYGHQFLIPVPDIDRSNFMLIIGGNPVASNGSMMTVPDVTKRLKSIQKRGGRFVVIDPRRTETAEIADEHLFIRPGSDAFLLMAMINVLFDEGLVDSGHLQDHLDDVAKVAALVNPFSVALAAKKTGIPADKIIALAREMASTEGAVCYGRMGVSVQVFGTTCQWAIQVINILSGSLDVPGGAMFTSPAFGYIGKGSSGSGNYNRWQSRVSGLPEFSGQIPSVALAEEILTPGDGQVRGLVTIAGNPVLAAPNGQQMDEALESLEFMVSVDFYINASTRHADVILPPTAALEHDHYDLAYHRLAVRNTARYNQAVFAPALGTKHDWEILNGVAEALARQKEMPFQAFPPPEQMISKGIRVGPYGVDNKERENQTEISALNKPTLEFDDLRQHPHGVDLGPLQSGAIGRLSTPSGKIVMAPAVVVNDMKRLSQAAESVDEGLLLIGRRHVRSNNSWMHNFHRLVKGKPRWQLLMHPDDLSDLGLADNSDVVIESRVGKVQTKVVASDEVMPGVVSLPHGWGHQRSGVKMAIASAQEGVSCNDITDQKLIDAVSGNAALNGVPVKVYAAA